ncbi:MAG: hypothetical protein ACSHX4_10580 [Opitutaceae bacterium]
MSRDLLGHIPSHPNQRLCIPRYARFADPSQSASVPVPATDVRSIAPRAHLRASDCSSRFQSVPSTAAESPQKPSSRASLRASRAPSAQSYLATLAIVPSLALRSDRAGDIDSGPETLRTKSHYAELSCEHSLTGFA